MPKSIKNIRKEFKESGIFYTPPALAEALKKYVDFAPRDVYDPTCGQGNLLAAFGDDIPKYGQELFAADLNVALERLPNFTGYFGDTLADDFFKGSEFHCIVANPPFSVKWTPNADDPRFAAAPCLPPPSKADYAFLLHILHHLAPDGKAVCLGFPGILYRGQREYKIRRWMIERNYIERVVHIPSNTFEDTGIATCILVLSKHKNTTDIIFEDCELQQERTVPLSEICDNDYNLSVSAYIRREIEREFVDIKAVNEAARAAFLQHIRASLSHELTVCAMTGDSITQLLNEIEKLTAEFRRHT